MMKAWSYIRKAFGTTPDVIEVDGRTLREDEHADFFRQLREQQEVIKAAEVVAAIDTLYASPTREGVLNRIIREIHAFKRNTGYDPKTYHVHPMEMNELWSDVNFQRLVITVAAPRHYSSIFGVELVVDDSGSGPRS